MRKWTSKLMTLVGVLLIILAIYFFAKPYIDNYLHEKDNDNKIENYNKAEKKQSTSPKESPQIPKDKAKMAGYGARHRSASFFWYDKHKHNAMQGTAKMGRPCG